MFTIIRNKKDGEEGLSCDAAIKTYEEFNKSDNEFPIQGKDFAVIAVKY